MQWQSLLTPVSCSCYTTRDFFRAFPSETFSIIASYWCTPAGAGVARQHPWQALVFSDVVVQQLSAACWEQPCSQQGQEIDRIGDRSWEQRILLLVEHRLSWNRLFCFIFIVIQNTYLSFLMLNSFSRKLLGSFYASKNGMTWWKALCINVLDE